MKNYVFIQKNMHIFIFQGMKHKIFYIIPVKKKAASERLVFQIFHCYLQSGL